MKRLNLLYITLILCVPLIAGSFNWYSQNDERWKSEQLGSGKRSIGSSGCVLSCLSMLLNAEASNEYMTPDRLNEWLKKMVAIPEVICVGKFPGKLTAAD